MNHSVTKPTLVDNLHAHPYVHIVSKYILLILLILPRMIQENPMKEFLSIDISEWDKLYRVLTVATESSLFLWLIPHKRRVDNILSSN